MPRTSSAMALRREAKFDKYAIDVREEARTEHLKPKKGDIEYTLNFTHAIYAGKQLIGRACSRRSALKRAHQWIKDHG